MNFFYRRQSDRSFCLNATDGLGSACGKRSMAKQVSVVDMKSIIRLRHTRDLLAVSTDCLRFCIPCIKLTAMKFKCACVCFDTRIM